jgi:hypothetical protein
MSMLAWSMSVWAVHLKCTMCSVSNVDNTSNKYLKAGN